MKNYEKYEDEIKKYKGDNFCKDFVIPHILKKDNCAGIYCSESVSYTHLRAHETTIHLV